MAEGAVRRVVRRLIPRRARWLARVAFRLITGLYLRDVIRHVRADHVDSARIETQEDILDLLLGRLRTFEEEVATLARSLGTLQEEVAALGQPLQNEHSVRTVAPLNLDRTRIGSSAPFGLWINDPVVVQYTAEGALWVRTNERVVEVPFTLQALSALAPPARIIEIEAQESLIALELASLGYRVTTVGIRPYAYDHPNLTVVKSSIQDWKGDGQPYDAAILLSTLEHLGLPGYGRTRAEKDADGRAMTRVHSLLRPGGLLVLTTPFGPSTTEETQRIYSTADLMRLLRGFQVHRCSLATRLDEKTWTINSNIDFESLAQPEITDKRDQIILIAAERQ